VSALAVFGPGADVEAEPVTLDGHALRVAFGPVPEPPLDPGPGAVLVAGEAFSCNYRDGGLALSVLHPAARGKLLVLGSEVAGRVAAVGDGVDAFAVGDRVVALPTFGPGTPEPWGVATNHASRPLQVLPAAKLARIPDAMPSEQAAAFALGATTAAAMLRRAELRDGDRVLVTSATSNTGLFCLALLGAGAIGLSTSAARAARASQLLGVPVVDSLPEGEFDVVLAPLGDVALAGVLDRVAFGGRIVTCGLRRPSAGGRDDSVVGALPALIQRNVTLVGNCLGTPVDFASAVAAWERGELAIPIDRVVDAAPGSAAAFFARTFTDPERVGKVVARHG